MKFSLPVLVMAAAAVTAVPAPAVEVEARADCTLYAHWQSHWIEAAFARYRVRVWSDGNTHGHNYPADFCGYWLNHGSFGSLSNPQCFNASDSSGMFYYADVSFNQGEDGLHAYRNSIQIGLNYFRDQTHCDVNSDL